jgi:two-component system chemotaxis sensor kinase CheA
MDDFEKELKLDFLEEATQLMESTEQAFLQLENDMHNKELIDEIFRFAHNLKGTSRAVGFGVVAEFTHEVENLILKIKQDEIELNDSVVSVLLECNDHITVMIGDLKDDFDKTFESEELIAKIIQAVGGDLVVAEEVVAEVEAAPVVEDDGFTVDEDLINHDLLAELEAMNVPSSDAFASEEEESAPLDIKEETVPVSEEKPLPGMNVFEGSENVTNIEEAQKKKEEVKKPVLKKDEKKPEKDESIRVSLSRVETLNNFVGELVILQSVLEQQKYTAIKDELAIKSIGQLSKLCKEIQEISMSLRMIPIKTTLQKMNRIVRDTSKTLNKKVNLVLSGEETEIDKTVLEHLADPLVHIVRNAVDHGLESTEERVSSGKSEKGNVNINACHEGNNLVIEVTDDGKGINPDIIRDKAIEKGILSPSSTISDQEVIQYIFHAGFSTKDQVSEVSGRGVGMDVVKTNIEKLSGDVRVHTEMGKGSVIKIVLPLTMAIIDGMIIRVGTEKFVIPIAQVQESLKPQKGDIHFATGLGDCLNLRGKVLPVRKISGLLKIEDATKGIEEQIVIIAKSKNGLIAVAVADIIQQQQVVIKKIGNEIKDQNGFMGSSILGDGKPAFIVDIDDLCSVNSKASNGQKAA